MDKKSQAIINGIHPWNRQSATNAFNECNDVALTGRAKMVLVYGARSVDEQNGLYALGRTKVNPDGKSIKKPMGNIVTNAKGFQSLHSPYGLAVDFALLIDGKTYKWDAVGDYDGDKISDWMEIVQIWEKHGWEAGIRWKSFVDPPHLQKSYGYSWQQLKVLYEAGKFIPGTKYIDLERKQVTNPNIFRTTHAVNMRKGPGVNNSVIMTILKGEYVLESSRSNGWSQISYKGISGYVSNQYLTK